MMLYLSGTYTVVPPQYRARLGYMLNVMRAIGGEADVLREHTWMLDNGAFSERWDETTWRARLEQLAPYHARCIAAVVPDVILDAQATPARWAQYAPVVKALGYRAAFATQNGCTPALVPWDEIDVLFIGGNDEHRRREIWTLIREAKRRGLWVHVGRVNSVRGIIIDPKNRTTC